MSMEFIALEYRDPIELIDIRDLSTFRYESKQQKYDILEVDALLHPRSQEIIRENHLKPSISINNSEIETKYTDLSNILEGGIVGLVFNKHKLSAARQKHCPFCSALMSFGDYVDESRPFVNSIGFGIGDNIATYGLLEYCFTCHFWRFQESYFYKGANGLYHLLHASLLSKIREFSERLPEGIVIEVAKWVKKHPDNWHTMSALSFEKLIAAIFRANYQDSEIMHVGGPNDGGKDVVFVDSGNRQWLIQAKRRMRPDAAEPIGTLRNLLGTMHLEDSNFGMIASTADHFTHKAYEAANRMKEKGVFIKLLDRSKLDRMLEKVVHMERPWYPILKENHPEIAEYFAAKIPSRKFVQSKMQF